MPSLKDIKRRIVSVKNTQKITHAMKLVSAAKFARANHSVLAARPYGENFERMASAVISNNDYAAIPLTEVRGQHKKILLVIVSTDRGLCGSLNSSMFKTIVRFVNEQIGKGVSIEFEAWGRRATLFCKKMNWPVKAEREKVTDKPKYSGAKQLAGNLVGQFEQDTYDAVHVGFVEFKSALSQVPVVKQLLPVSSMAAEGRSMGSASTILEPAKDELVKPLIDQLIVSKVFSILLESAASEHGARMTAMDSATKNAKEVIRKLTLQYNRGRQAAITKELIEITSGAEAL